MLSCVCECSPIFSSETGDFFECRGYVDICLDRIILLLPGFNTSWFTMTEQQRGFHSVNINIPHLVGKTLMHLETRTPCCRSEDFQIKRDVILFCHMRDHSTLTHGFPNHIYSDLCRTTIPLSMVFQILKWWS